MARSQGRLCGPKLRAPHTRTRGPGLAGRGAFRGGGRTARHVETRRASPAHDANLRQSPAEPCIAADKNGRWPRFSGARPTVAAFRTRRCNGANPGEDMMCGTRGQRRAPTDLRRRTRPTWPTFANTRLGPWQRALRPRSHPSVSSCMLLGRRTAPRFDVHMTSPASRFDHFKKDLITCQRTGAHGTRRTASPRPENAPGRNRHPI